MSKFHPKFILLPGILLFGLCTACKTPAPAPAPTLASTPAPEQLSPKTPGGEPQFELVFDRIEAKSVDQVSLFYILQTENPRSEVLPAEIKAWEVQLDGAKPASAALTAIPGEWSASPSEAPVPSGRPARGALLGAPGEESRTFGLRLDLDLPATPHDFDEYNTDLRVSLAWQYGAEEPSVTELRAAVTFPRIREPEFTITSIAVMQAELINTRFRVSLRIDNPNFFPVDLSSLGYELYGTGRFWAEGKERNVLEVPARGYTETRLLLVTNFIGMQRGLLDEVVAKGRVPYRFTGEALVNTGIAMLPEFHMDFSRSGVSIVVD
jgi:LEA14-like dessication related protein